MNDTTEKDDLNDLHAEMVGEEAPEQTQAVQVREPKETDEAKTLAKTPPAERPKKAPIKGGGKIEAIIPRDIDEAYRMAQAMCVAGMIPASYEGKTDKETVSRVMVGIQKSLEVGFPPITGLATIMVINGRACIWGDGALALVQKSDKLEWIKETLEGEDGKDDWTAVCEMKRVGNHEPIRRTFSVKDAKRAKLWANPRRAPWIQYPQRMLQMRARAWAIRDGFSDCLSGLQIAEEINDIPAEVEKPDTKAMLE